MMAPSRTIETASVIVFDRQKPPTEQLQIGLVFAEALRVERPAPGRLERKPVRSASASGIEPSYGAEFAAATKAVPPQHDSTASQVATIPVPNTEKPLPLGQRRFLRALAALGHWLRIQPAAKNSGWHGTPIAILTPLEDRWVQNPIAVQPPVDAISECKYRLQIARETSMAKPSHRRPVPCGGTGGHRLGLVAPEIAAACAGMLVGRTAAIAIRWRGAPHVDRHRP